MTTPPPDGGEPTPTAAPDLTATEPPTPTGREKFTPALPLVAAGLVACVVGSIGSRLLNPLPVSALPPLALAVTYLVLLATAAGLWHLRTVWTARRPAGRTVTAYTDPRGPATDPSPVNAADATQDSLLDRIRTILADKHPDVIIVAGSVEFDRNGALSAFSLQSTTPAGFALQQTRERVFQQVSESIKGRWNLFAEPERDTIHFRTKKPFPAAIAPPLPDRVARSAADALSIYETLALKLGVDEDGNELTADIQALPHWLFIGGTGSGKSVFMRGAVIEPLRAAGAMIMIGDGKTTDYSALINLPNIVTVAQTYQDQMRMLRLAADELEARQADAKNIQLSRSGENPFQRPPLVVVLDEFATTINNIKADDKLGKEALARFVSDLKFLLRIGREFKVHVAIASQEAYRTVIDGQMMANLTLRVSLGPPEGKTISEVFPKKLETVAERIGGGINKERDRGRGLAYMSTEDDEVVMEFQSYYGYTPNPSKPSPPVLVAAHEQYRTQVSDQIPQLYPRLWWKMDGPEYTEDLDALYGTTAVALDDATGRPDPANFKYDPLHPDYVGASSGGGSPIPSLTELQAGAVYSPPPPRATTRPDDVADDLDDFGDGTLFGSLDVPANVPPAPKRDEPPTEPSEEDPSEPAESLASEDDPVDTASGEGDQPPWPEDSPAKPSRPGPPHPNKRPNTGAVNI